MTVSQLKARIYKRLDETPQSLSGTGFYTDSEVLTAINAAQRLFVLLTLCLESTGSLSLDAGTCWYLPMSTFSNWLLPLRVRVNGGGKVHPARLDELDALSSSWQATAGTPERYCSLGFNLLAIYKQPSSSGTSLDVTYARCPSVLASTADEPEIPAEHHPCLIPCSIVLLRAKEGGQEFTKVIPMLDEFLSSAKKMSEFVRSRNRAAGYDVEPFELKRWDASRLAKVVERAARAIPRA